MIENVVEITRYIRVSDERFSHDLRSPDKFFDHDNLYGITMLFTIDYNSMVVKAKHSVCNGDNFSKEEGKSRAELNHVECYFPAELIEKHGGTVEAYLHFLQEAYDYKINPRVFEDVMSLFRYVGNFHGKF